MIFTDINHSSWQKFVYAVFLNYTVLKHFGGQKHIVIFRKITGTKYNGYRYNKYMKLR